MRGVAAVTEDRAPPARDSRILLALACLPFLPAALSSLPTLTLAASTAAAAAAAAPGWATRHGERALAGRDTDGHGRAGERGPEGSVGCSVNLPLGSRSVDPHSTAVWCGNLLHSSPQSHTADVVLFCHSSFGGVPATTTKICSGGRSSRDQSQLDQRSPLPILHRDALPWLPRRWQTVRERFTDLGTVHFRSCALRQVSCYTFLSGFQPSWPPTCYP